MARKKTKKISARERDRRREQRWAQWEKENPHLQYAARRLTQSAYLFGNPG